jgi:hypothetical protein
MNADDMSGPVFRDWPVFSARMLQVKQRHHTQLRQHHYAREKALQIKGL